MKFHLRWAAIALLVAVLYLWAAPQARAEHLPHLTDATGFVHYNVSDVYMPQAGGGAPSVSVLSGGGLTAGGPCGASGIGSAFFACNFFDGANLPNNNWAWETAIHNPFGNPQLTNIPVGFFFPGGPLLGELTLDPNSTFHIGIVVNDGAAYGEMGNRSIWYNWNNPEAIFVDAAVIEHTNVLPVPSVNGNYWWHFHSSPNDAFVLNPNVDINNLAFSFRDPTQESAAIALVASVPVPAAVWLFGSGLAGLIGFARRKKRAV